MTHSQLKKVRIFIPKKEILKLIESKVKKILENNRKSIENVKTAQNILRKKLNIQNSTSEKYFTVNLSTINDFGIWNATSHLPKYSGVEGEIKKKFKTISLRNIVSIKKGTEVGSDNYKTDLFKNNQDYAFIRTSDITNNEIDIYPDYFVSQSIAEEINNLVKGGEIIFSKDGIIGETAIISKYDRAIIASGFAIIKLKAEAKQYNLTSEYLFIVLSSDEVGFYPAIRRTVIASTIPHLREERLKEIEIPILDKNSIDEITKLVKEAFELKDEKKKLIQEVREEIDSYFEI
jgi:type I restriction enzyme S subunit